MTCDICKKQLRGPRPRPYYMGSDESVPGFAIFLCKEHRVETEVALQAAALRSRNERMRGHSFLSRLADAD